MTKLNEQMLQEVAAAGHGVYVHASEGEVGLNPILAELQKLDKTQFDSKMFVDYDNKFYLFVWPALFLLVLDFFITETKSKWLAKLNLFGERRKGNE